MSEQNPQNEDPSAAGFDAAVPPPPPPPPPAPEGEPIGEPPPSDELPPEPPAPDAGEVPWQVPNPTPPWPAAPPPVDPSVPPPPAAWAAAPGPAAPPAPYPPQPAPPPAYGVPPGPPPGPPGAPPFPPQVPGYPQAPGYPQQPGYGPVGGPPPPQFVDPHGIGQAAFRLGSGGRRAGKVPFLILASVLGDEDIAEIVVAGRVHGLPGAATLVGNKVVLVNDREWKPDVVEIPLTPSLQVHGWQDDRVASLTFVDSDRHEVVERIPDRPLAIEFAQRVRDRIMQAAAQPPSDVPAAPDPGMAPPEPPAPPDPSFG